MGTLVAGGLNGITFTLFQEMQMLMGLALPFNFFFFFERASLIFIDQMVVNNNKIQYRGVNAQCTIINPSQA